MWNEINNHNDIVKFMNFVCFFHDSCIKEFRYLSGAYVDEECSMYPINDQRVLNIIIQRQFSDASMIELEFAGIKYLKLLPCDEKHTCEILDATLLLKGKYIYWCDCGGVLEEDLDSYNGTSICASKLRWRTIDGCMGNEEFYRPRDKTVEKTGDG